MTHGLHAHRSYDTDVLQPWLQQVLRTAATVAVALFLILTLCGALGLLMERL